MHDPEKIAQNLATLIREKRTALGLSHEELAVRAGLDRSTVSLYESGKRVATISSAVRIANALEIRLSDLLKQAES